jgi:hypothetical protein
VKAGQRPKWNDIVDSSLIYNSYWAQWNFMMTRDSVLERHWESADGGSEGVQSSRSSFPSKVKEMLEQFQGGSSEERLGIK